MFALFGLLLFFATGLSANDYTFEWQYSLYSPYVNGKGENNNWEMEAFVNNHHFVQLTPDIDGRSGYVFTKNKFSSSNWFIETTFNIKAQRPHNAGDGMAIWFVEEPFQPGRAFGYSERFKGLGIFFDLYPNAKQSYKFPYISAMINDGTRMYDHDTDGQGQLLGGCHAEIVNSETPIHAKIVYNQGTLEVHLFVNHHSGWTPCIKLQNVKLPASGYIGATALTGAATAAHEIIGITTGSFKAGNGDSFANAEYDEEEKSHTFLFLILLTILGAGAGYHYWRKEKKRRYF